MIRCLIYFLLASMLISCNGSGDESTETATEIKTINKHFSDSLNADTFRIKMVGNKNGKHLVFTITSFEGKLIYEEDIKADDLFKNYDATINLKKKNNQIKFLNEEMERFFDDENFLEPAIMEQEIPDQHVPDKVFYEELKKSQLNGFIYRLGKENKRYIGWSAKENKVKAYYDCCKSASSVEK